MSLSREAMELEMTARGVGKTESGCARAEGNDLSWLREAEERGERGCELYSAGGKREGHHELNRERERIRGEREELEQ